MNKHTHSHHRMWPITTASNSISAIFSPFIECSFIDSTNRAGAKNRKKSVTKKTTRKWLEKKSTVRHTEQCREQTRHTHNLASSNCGFSRWAVSTVIAHSVLSAIENRQHRNEWTGSPLRIGHSSIGAWRSALCITKRLTPCRSGRIRNGMHVARTPGPCVIISIPRQQIWSSPNFNSILFVSCLGLALIRPNIFMIYSVARAHTHTHTRPLCRLHGKSIERSALVPQLIVRSQFTLYQNNESFHPALSWTHRTTEHNC